MSDRSRASGSGLCQVLTGSARLDCTAVCFCLRFFRRRCHCHSLAVGRGVLSVLIPNQIHAVQNATKLTSCMHDLIDSLNDRVQFQ